MENYKERNENAIVELKEKIYSKILSSDAEEGTAKKTKSSDNLNRDTRKKDQESIHIERAVQTNQLRQIRFSVSPSLMVRQSQISGSVLTSRIVPKQVRRICL